MANKYFLIPVIALTLASCSQSDEPGQLSEPKQASFSAQIGQTSSRAADTQWTAADAIGISGVSGSKTYSNVKFVTAAGDGNFASAGEAIYYQTTDEVTFTAYYPYAAAGGVITASTADQSQQPSFDFLWAQASGSYASPAVNFNFAHKMSRLALTFVNGNDVDLTGMTYTVGGLVADGTFDTATGEAKIAAEAALTTLSAPVSTEGKSSLIVFPQSAGTLEVTATAGGQKYTCELSLGTLAAGASYNISITVKKTGMTVTGSTISDWTEGGNFSGEATIPGQPLGDKTADAADVGDFYLKDGSLVDKDATLTDAQKEACIGIVFTTDPRRIGDGAKSALAAKGVTPHGLVMALTNAGENCNWGDYAILEEGLTITGHVSDMYSNVNGYSDTQRIVNHYDISHYPAFSIAINYGKTEGTSGYAAPDDLTTGWFLPSVGNWWDILRNLGNQTDLDDLKYNDGERVHIPEDAQYKTYDYLNRCISQIESATKFESHISFCTSSVMSDRDMWCIDLELYTTLITKKVKQSPFTVRCVLAF